MTQKNHFVPLQASQQRKYSSIAKAVVAFSSNF